MLWFHPKLKSIDTDKIYLNTSNVMVSPPLHICNYMVGMHLNTSNVMVSLHNV